MMRSTVLKLDAFSGGDVADSFEEDKFVNGTEVPFVRHCQLDFVLVLVGIVLHFPRAAKVGVEEEHGFSLAYTDLFRVAKKLFCPGIIGKFVPDVIHGQTAGDPFLVRNHSIDQKTFGLIVLSVYAEIVGVYFPQDPGYLGFLAFAQAKTGAAGDNQYCCRNKKTGVRFHNYDAIGCWFRNDKKKIRIHQAHHFFH